MSAFDPSAFLAAETAPAPDEPAFPDSDRLFDFRQFCAGRLTVPPTPVDAPAGPWKAGLELLATLPCPPDWTPAAWDYLVFQALKLAREWGGQALAAGWSELELFGCNSPPFPQARRLDRDGLLIALGIFTGWVVAALDASGATIRGPRGQTLRFQRGVQDLGNAVPVWSAFAARL